MKGLQFLFSLCFCALATTFSLTEAVYSQTKKPNRTAKAANKKTRVVPIQKISPSIFEATPGGAEVLPGGEYVNRVLGFRYTAPKPYKPFLPTNSMLRDFASFVDLTDPKEVQISMMGNRLQFCSSSEEYADGEEKHLSKQMDGFETIEKSKTQIGALDAVRLVYKFKRITGETGLSDNFHVCRPIGNSSNTYQFSMTASPELYEKYKNILEAVIAGVKFEKPTK